MTKPTLDDLLTQKNTLEQEIEKVQIEPLEAVVEAFSTPEYQAILTVLSENLPQLLGERATQLANLFTVMNSVPTILMNDLNHLKVVYETEEELPSEN